jgi:hypothetical protein
MRGNAATAASPFVAVDVAKCDRIDAAAGVGTEATGGNQWQMSLGPRRGVVHEDKISWPTRGPNVDSTIGSTMRSGAYARAENACK